jgi:hypothetical protein
MIYYKLKTAAVRPAHAGAVSAHGVQMMMTTDHTGSRAFLANSTHALASAFVLSSVFVCSKIVLRAQLVLKFREIGSLVFGHVRLPVLNHSSMLHLSYV